MLTLYAADGANCCERVRWALAYKGVPHACHDPADPAHAAAWAAASPFGRVPILVVEGRPLSESMAMLEWLEERVPEPPLLPQGAWARARVREVCEAVNASIHPVQNSGVLARIRPDWTRATMRPFRAQWLHDNLQALAPLLWQDGPWAVGPAFTLADILVAVIARKACALGAPPLAPFEAHWAHLMAQPAIAAACPPATRGVAVSAG